MDRVINVDVNGNFVRKDSKNAGVRGEGNAAKLHITMSEGWKQYSKRIVWRDALGGRPVAVLLYKSVGGTVVTASERSGTEGTNPLIFDTTIPSEPMTEEGWCSFTIEGFADGEPSSVAISVTDYLLVKPNDSYNAPAEPTASQAQQLQVQMDKITEDTAAIVQEAVDALDQAEQDVKVWEPWDSTKTYRPLQKVYRLGSSYICTKTNVDVDPWADVDEGDGIKGSYWMLIARKGDRGEQGISGKKGDTGPQGIQGVKGDQGIQGPQGIRGPEGPRGIDGVTVETSGMVGFSVNAVGHLICTYTGNTAPGYSIGEDGHLYLEV